MTTMDLYRRELTVERIQAALSNPSFSPPQRHRTYFVRNSRGQEVGLAPLARLLTPQVAKPNAYDIAQVLLEKGIQIHVKSTTPWHEWMDAYAKRGLVIRED